LLIGNPCWIQQLWNMPVNNEHKNQAELRMPIRA
jgi:hypothetical protein